MSNISAILGFAGAILLFLGVIVFVFEIIGIYKYKYVFNRMHAAGMGDTLGLFLCLAGLGLISGFTFTTLKIALVIILMWFTSPTSSHLIASLVALTDDKLNKNADVRVDDLESFVGVDVKDDSSQKEEE